MTEPEDQRWTTEIEELVARAIYSTTLAAGHDLWEEFGGDSETRWYMRKRAMAVLEALFEAGLLLAPNGQISVEYGFVSRDSGNAYFFRDSARAREAFGLYGGKTLARRVVRVVTEWPETGARYQEPWHLIDE